jgi:DNA-binding transcriptional MerR regulator
VQIRNTRAPDCFVPEPFAGASGLDVVARIGERELPMAVAYPAAAVPVDAFTLPQLSKAFGAPYRTLHSWVERDMVSPSVHRATGTGRANLFDRQDALTVAILSELREAGVTLDLLRRAAERLHERRDDLARPVYLLVNGDVAIVADGEAVAAALTRGGAMLALHTGKALDLVEALQAS